MPRYQVSQAARLHGDSRWFEDSQRFCQSRTTDLSESKADDSTLEAISGLSKLIELELWLSRITDAGLVHIVKLPLKSLTLEDIYDVGDPGWNM